MNEYGDGILPLVCGQNDALCNIRFIVHETCREGVCPLVFYGLGS